MSNPPHQQQQHPYGGRGGGGSNRNLNTSAWQPTPTTSSLQQAAGTNPYAAYQQQGGYHHHHHPAYAGAGGYYNPAAQATNPYYAAQHAAYYGAAAYQQQQQQQGQARQQQQPVQHQQQPPPKSKERRALVITDKNGNPIDLGSSTKSLNASTSSLMGASTKSLNASAKNLNASASKNLDSGNSAGNKLLEAARARIASSSATSKSKEEEEKKKKHQQEEETKKKEEAAAAAAAAKLAAEEEAAKKKAEQEEKKAEEEAAAAAAASKVAAPQKNGKRHVYSKQDLLRFRDLKVCLCRPDDLPDMTIERGPSRGNNSNQGGGGGGGGGRHHGGGGKWSRGAAPPRRQSTEGNNEAPAQQQQQQQQPRQGGGGQWSRGQAPPPPPKNNNNNNKGGRGGGRNNSYMEPSMNFKPLVKSDNRWKPQKSTSSLVVAEKAVKAILNKMTKEKFQKLAQDMCEIPLDSYDTLSMIIGRVYEKAIEEPLFGDMYADLCVMLSEHAQFSSFVHYMESDEESENGTPVVYRWSNDVSHDDEEIVGPFEDVDDSIEAALADETMEPIKRGEMKLELVKLKIKFDTFIKVLKTVDKETEEFYVVFFPMAQAEECGQQMSEFFLTDRECKSDASKNNSFKRSLLNKCEDEFNKNDIYTDWTTEKAAYEAGKDKLTERERAEQEEDLEFRRIKIKKQMIGNIKFIGQLYKKQLLKEKIMRYCISSLLKLDEDKTLKTKNLEYKDSGKMDIDEEDHEAICNMFSTIGKSIDTPQAKHFVKICFTKIAAFSVDKNIPTRSRFMYKDLIELRQNKWEPRRKQEKAKTLDEIRKDVEREERQQAAQSNQYGGGRGGGRGGGGGGRGGNQRNSFRDDRRPGNYDNNNNRGNRQSRQQPQQQQVDDDGFTTISGSRGGGSGGGGGGGARTSFRRSTNTTPPKGMQGSSPPRNRNNYGGGSSLQSAASGSPTRKSSAPPVPAAAPPPPQGGGGGPAPLSEEKLQRRLDGMREEFMQDSNNLTELLLSMDELSGTPNAGLTLVQKYCDKIMDAKENERQAMTAMIPILYEKKKLSASDVKGGLMDMIEFIDSFVCDAPKAFQYLGDLVAPMLEMGAIDISWLCEQTNKTKVGETNAPERVVKETMVAFKTKYGAEKAQAFFGKDADKLADLLGNDKWNEISSATLS